MTFFADSFVKGFCGLLVCRLSACRVDGSNSDLGPKFGGSFL